MTGSEHVWVYLAGDQRGGPTSAAEIGLLLSTGALPPDLMVWRPGDVEWRRASLVPEILASWAPPVPEPCMSAAREHVQAVPVSPAPAVESPVEAPEPPVPSLESPRCEHGSPEGADPAIEDSQPVAGRGVSALSIVFFIVVPSALFIGAAIFIGLIFGSGGSPTSETASLTPHQGEQPQARYAELSPTPEPTLLPGPFWSESSNHSSHREVSRDEARESGSASNRQDASGENAVGMMYQLGQGVPVDLVTARKWYEKAASHGSSAAHYNLGLMYYSGEGVPQDPARAAALYQTAAEMGLPVAMNALGGLYESGVGVARDLSKAEAHYRAAAERGDQGGKDNLARLLLLRADGKQ